MLYDYMQLTTYIPFLKNHTKLILLVCIGSFLSPNSWGQSNGLRVKYNLFVDDGKSDGSKVTIERDGQKWKVRDGADGKNNIDLDYQHDYIFSFSKNGYVTKKVFISTKVPKSSIKDGFDPYVFDITIYKQFEGVNVVMFNQPVARIVFKEDIDNFEYDTDYTKSVLANMQTVEEELKKKKKEEKKNPSTAKKEPISKKNNEGDGSEEKHDAENMDKNNSETAGKQKVATENDSRTKINAQTESDDKRYMLGKTEGSDRNPNKTKNNFPEKREEKQFVEGNKRITEITITKQGKTFVYRKVVYIWGVFYFRNNISITESTYIQEAL